MKSQDNSNLTRMLLDSNFPAFITLIKKCFPFSLLVTKCNYFQRLKADCGLVSSKSWSKGKTLASFTCVRSQTLQTKSIIFSIHSKVFVFSPAPIPIKISYLYSQLLLSLTGQPVDVEKSEPEFSLHITKPLLVVHPSAVKINRAVHSPLNDSPGFSGGVNLITIDLKGSFTIWINGINTV